MEWMKGVCGWYERTVEGFDLGKEPIKPTPLEIQLSKLFEPSFLVYLRVVGELSSLDETEYDRVFEPGQNGTDPIEREGISGERVVGLHSWESGGGGGEGKGDGRGCSSLDPYLYQLLRWTSQCPLSVSPIDHVSFSMAAGQCCSRGGPK